MATIQNVAKQAGVSVGTVSNVINKKPFVSDQTQRKVEQAIRELDYQPNAIARSLRKGKSQALALAVLDLSNPFYPEVIKGVGDAAEACGYHVITFDIAYNPQNQGHFIKKLRELRVEGAICTAGCIDAKFHHPDLPVVVVDCDIHELDFSTVGIDNATAVADGVQYLIQQGHRRIGYLSEPLEITTVHQRLKGYQRALHNHNIPYDSDIVFISDELRTGKVRSGYELMQHVIDELEDLPTAFFSTSDIIAIGAMKALKEHGFRIPEDISMMGFDDIILAQFTDPGLTTIAQRKQELGRRAVGLLLERITNPEAPLIRVILETRLVVRDSVASPLGLDKVST